VVAVITYQKIRAIQKRFARKKYSKFDYFTYFAEIWLPKSQINIFNGTW
jgi:hypothetical protein